ncbi:NAC-domain-containing protein [Meredithblackwellia eburnea MCA 4105]
MSGIDVDKLARLQAQVRIGGKGTPRRKAPVKGKTSGGDDKKLQAALKKLNVTAMPGVEEVNMFREEETSVLHFQTPKVHASIPSNVYAIYGQGVEKEMTELVPGILNQLGPDAMANLRRLAEQYQSSQQAAGGAGKEKEADEEDDDEPPELVAADPEVPKDVGGLEEIN